MLKTLREQFQLDEFQFNIDRYTELLRAVASLSRLYSDNEKAYLDSRFVEKLFIYTSGAKDLSRKDNSFDALLGSAGVGIKTFGITNANSKKTEKIAEFTTLASQGAFNGLSQEELAFRSAEIRNARVKTDAAEYGINIDTSFYHCLLRTNKGAIIHEEPYSYINISKIKPVDPNSFKEINEFPTGVGFPYFSDGTNIYSYNTSKNVLFKRFDISKGLNSNLIPLLIQEGIFEKLLIWFRGSSNNNISKVQQEFATYNIAGRSPQFLSEVVLPLYSLRESKSKSKRLGRSVKVVAEKSGINQWNAGGRDRKFGEAYIPIPRIIHEKYPSFFPPKDQTFALKLPNGKTVSAKICQENGKALMSNPNHLICEWLFNSIDPNFSEKEYMERLNQHKFYTYEDLEFAGKDAVKVSKLNNTDFEIEFMPLDSFEAFINNEADSDSS